MTLMISRDVEKRFVGKLFQRSGAAQKMTLRPNIILYKGTEEGPVLCEQKEVKWW